MRKGRIWILATLLALLGAGWWFGSPWWTLWRMREAAQAGDAQALAAYIDFPALREQLGLGPLGGLVAGPAVDALVSPKALELALGSGRRSGGGSASGSGAKDVDPVRTGASEFRVRSKRSDLVFRRHGLGWKLEEIRLRSAP